MQSLQTANCNLQARKSGLSLIEALLFAVLALLVFGAVWNLLTRSVSITDETTRSLELQTGVRNLMENLVEDVNTAHVVLDPPGSTTSTLSLLKYQSADATERLKLNTRVMYPFSETDEETDTQDILPVFRTTYTFVPERKEVMRVVEKAELVSSDEKATKGFFTKFEVRNAQKVYEKPVAGSVALFSLAYAGYDQNGEPALVEDLPKPSYQKTAFLLVKLRTVFDEGLYGGPGRRTPTVEIATKIWCYKKISDLMYREYFSSADEDSRF